jgi:hypothetical protein
MSLDTHLNSNVHFPEELKPFVKLGQTSETRANLLAEVVVNNATREQFNEWAQKHENFVSNSPMMQQISNVVNHIQVQEEDKSELQDGGVALFINSLFINSYVKRLFNSDTLCDKIERDSIKDFPTLKRDPALINEYFEIGAISEEEIFKIIEDSFPNKRNISDYFQTIIPLLQNLSIDNLLHIFSKKESGILLLSDHANFKAAMPVLQKLPIEHLEKILALENDDGSNALTGSFDFLKQYGGNYGELNFAVITNRLPPEDLIRIASIEDGNSAIPLDNTKNANAVLPKLQHLPMESFIKAARTRNNEGKLPLSYPSFFRMVVERLDKCSNEELTQALAIQNNAGFPLLHEKKIFWLVTPWIAEGRIDLERILYSSGLSFKEISSRSLSSSWITKSKEAAAVTLVDKDAYDQRVATLKPRAEKLWSSLSFGTAPGEVSPLLLEISTSDNEKRTYTPQEILTTLNEIIELMVKETAWLGTPPPDKTEELHQFYSGMLVDFEEIISKLEGSENKNEIAGYLISMAAVRLEGRCASAYRAETRQKKELLLGKDCNVNSLIKTASEATLQSIIERIVRDDYQSDSHAMNQFSYAAGLSSGPDYLTHITLEDAQRELVEECNMHEMYEGFKAGVPFEYAIDWLKINTPKAYGEKYLDLKKKMEEKEGVLIDGIKMKLSATIPSEQVEKILKILPSIGTTLSSSNLKTASKEELLEKAFSTANAQLKSLKSSSAQLRFFLKPETFISDPNGFSKADLVSCKENIQKELVNYKEKLKAEIANEAYKNADSLKIRTAGMARAEKNAFIESQKREPLPELTQEEKKSFLSNKTETEKLGFLPDRVKMLYTQELVSLTNTTNALVKQLEATLEFDKMATEAGIPSENRLDVLQAKDLYEAELKNLGEMVGNEEISFSRSDHGLPSRACEEARQLEYNEQYMNDPKKVYLHILSELGVLETSINNH